MTGVVRLAACVTLAMISVAQARDVRSSGPDTIDSGCEAFGKGFRKLDGLDTCMKIDGRVRVESSYQSGINSAFLPASARSVYQGQ